MALPAVCAQCLGGQTSGAGDPELIPYKKGAKWGFADRNRNLVISARYDFAFRFSDGLAAVELDRKWGCVDRTGKVVIPIKYDEIIQIKDGLVLVGIMKPDFTSTNLYVGYDGTEYYEE